MDTVESFKFVGAIFLDCLNYTGSWDIHVFSYTYVTKRNTYDFLTLIYWFMEDVNLWMRGTPNFTKIEPPRNVMILPKQYYAKKK